MIATVLCACADASGRCTDLDCEDCQGMGCVPVEEETMDETRDPIRDALAARLDEAGQTLDTARAAYYRARAAIQEHDGDHEGATWSRALAENDHATATRCWLAANAAQAAIGARTMIEDDIDKRRSELAEAKAEAERLRAQQQG